MILFTANPNNEKVLFWLGSGSQWKQESSAETMRQTIVSPTMMRWYVAVLFVIQWAIINQPIKQDLKHIYTALHNRFEDIPVDKTVNCWLTIGMGWESSHPGDREINTLSPDRRGASWSLSGDMTTCISCSPVSRKLGWWMLTHVCHDHTWSRNVSLSTVCLPSGWNTFTGKILISPQDFINDCHLSMSTSHFETCLMKYFSPGLCWQTRFGEVLLCWIVVIVASINTFDCDQVMSCSSGLPLVLTGPHSTYLAAFSLSTSPPAIRMSLLRLFCIHSSCNVWLTSGLSPAAIISLGPSQQNPRTQRKVNKHVQGERMRLAKYKEDESIAPNSSHQCDGPVMQTKIQDSFW